MKPGTILIKSNEENGKKPFKRVLPSNPRCMKSKWALKIKCNSVYLVWLIACDYSQAPGVDFYQIYSPVLNDIGFCILLLMVIHCCKITWGIHTSNCVPRVRDKLVGVTVDTILVDMAADNLVTISVEMMAHKQGDILKDMLAATMHIFKQTTTTTCPISIIRYQPFWPIFWHN